MGRGLRSFISIIVVALLLSACGAPTPVVEHIIYDGRIETATGVYMDSMERTLTFGEGSQIVYEGGSFDVSGRTFECAVEVLSIKLYFHPGTQELSTVGAHGNICLGTISNSYPLCQLNMDQKRFFVDDLSLDVIKVLREKKVACLGDSMTTGKSDQKLYAQWMGEMCGFSEVQTCGLAGSCIASKVDELPAWDTGIATYWERVALLDEDAEVIIVLGGLNDWATARDLGQITDSGTDTFCGAMNTLCAKLKQKYPEGEIFFFSSPQINYVDCPAGDLEDTPWENNVEGYNRKGLLLTQYNEAMEQICRDNGIAFLSLTKGLPWGVEELGDNQSVSGIYGSDGVNPNSAGHRRVAYEMIQFIAEKIC